MSYIDKINNQLDARNYVGLFLLRVFIGIRLIYGVIDNIIAWERMMEFSSFLESFNFPFPVISAITSVYLQFIGGILILIGYKIRLASIVLAFNFLIAIIFVHIKANDSIEAMTPAMAMLFGCLTLIFTGAGKISIDSKP